MLSDGKRLWAVEDETGKVKKLQAIKDSVLGMLIREWVCSSITSGQWRVTTVRIADFQKGFHVKRFDIEVFY